MVIVNQVNVFFAQKVPILSKIVRLKNCTSFETSSHKKHILKNNFDNYQTVKNVQSLITSVDNVPKSILGALIMGGVGERQMRPE